MELLLLPYQSSRSPLLIPNNNYTSLSSPPTPPLCLFLFPNQKNKNRNNQKLSRFPRVRASVNNAPTPLLPHSAIQRIADKLRTLGFDNDDKETSPPLSPPLADDDKSNKINNGVSPGQIFVPLPTDIPKYRVGHTFDSSWSTPENPVPEPGTGTAIRRYHELRSEVLVEKGKRRKVVENNVPSLAELKLSSNELKRLRTIGIKLKQKLKVGKAGVTEGIVNGIHERWRHTELVKIKCDDICRLNMKRTHDLIERKTGGLVIWRSGSNMIVYRGAEYKYPYFLNEDDGTNKTLQFDDRIDGENEKCSSLMDGVRSAGSPLSNKTVKPPLIQGVGSPNRVRFQLPGELQLAEESDHLLDGLGPRFTDWWGYDPLPVDADLLPAVVSGYRKPFRLLPYGVKPILTNDEMTTLKRLGRPLPCHFALGRNRNLQGLAAAIIKLWERCEIAKIAIKRGVQNTNSELIAKELKWLTGGVLLSRDREYIVLYRGKDFLPAKVSVAIEQQRNRLHGEKNRRDFNSSAMDVQNHKPGTVDVDLKTENRGIGNNPVVPAIEAENYVIDHKNEVLAEQRKLRSIEEAVTRTNSKLSLALAKKARAETLLTELEKEEILQPSEIDKEGITEEERYMLRKVGLRMKPFLLLGRRGVFDGTVENMHLHWKYRELVKIICGERSIEEVHARARTLEAESGGILVAVERISKGYAIIVYRGKNYKRPSSLRPQTLLSKREAMKRSIEAQRRESLKLHVLKLDRDVDELQNKLARDQERVNMQLAKDLILQTGKKDESDKGHSKIIEKSYDVLPNSSENAFSHQENVEGIDTDKAKYTFTNTNNCVDSAREDLQTTPEDMWTGLSTEDDVKDRDKLRISDSVLVTEDTDGFKNMNGEVVHAESMVPISGNTDRSQDHFSDIGNTGSLEESSLNSSKSEVLVHKDLEVCSGDVPIKAARLSNKERLLLRKQALGVKKRPVLAVGKNNIVSGVAKTIKTHFQKHPLAIVNIKGRAKGTSIQEVVQELERATGAVLVSQEPSKVILHRGWGAGDEPGPGQSMGNKTIESGNTPRGQDKKLNTVISPELISAIKLECGLEFSRGENTVGYQESSSEMKQLPASHEIEVTG
ncbi:CRM-domain containing factor CFM2, chloroplastic [Heracleum sosnowskyi]|uniref:CRM-domain containing factor CFM2, chloroplastic n=1 Tax=Heracleum sosnowskyi TaxID=360622 RepID=A0AAD8J5Q1_9APIA|nr:CRM-domain containing factor CFM2, chloroplastic [Heracleum sosnowskyi]